MQQGDITRTVRFRTARLEVAEWHSATLPPNTTLVEVLTGLLTTTTTRSLPPAWHGDYDLIRAASWLKERDDESATLLVTSIDTAAPVGLMILFELPLTDGSDLVDVRLGYLLAESAWGQGLGSEMIAGFIDWCRATCRIRSISGGVAVDNPASARVLAKSGFLPADSTVAGEQVYELDLSIQ